MHKEKRAILDSGYHNREPPQPMVVPTLFVKSNADDYLKCKGFICFRELLDMNLGGNPWFLPYLRWEFIKERFQEKKERNHAVDQQKK